MIVNKLGSRGPAHFQPWNNEQQEREGFAGFRLSAGGCLQALEQNLSSLALTSFGVMDTTLEEVFLKVSEEDQSLENSDAGAFPLILTARFLP